MCGWPLKNVFSAFRGPTFLPSSYFVIPPADPVCVCVCVPVSDNLSNSPISVPVTSTPVSRPDKVITGSPSPSSTSTTSTTTTTATTAASSSSSVLGAPSAVLSSSSATADPVSSRVSTAVPGGHVSVSVPPSRPPSKSRPAPSVVTVAVPVPDRSPIYTRSLAAKKKKAASSPAPAIAPIRVATQTFYNSERRRSVGGASAVVAAVPPSSAIVPVDNSKSSCGTSVSVAGTPVNAPTDRPQPTANPSAAPVCEKNLSPTSRPAPAPCPNQAAADSDRVTIPPNAPRPPPVVASVSAQCPCKVSPCVCISGANVSAASPPTVPLLPTDIPLTYPLLDRMCPVCNNFSGTTNRISAHIRSVHAKQVTFMCRGCRHFFRSLGIVKRHFNRDHGGHPSSIYLDDSDSPAAASQSPPSQPIVQRISVGPSPATIPTLPALPNGSFAKVVKSPPPALPSAKALLPLATLPPSPSKNKNNSKIRKPRPRKVISSSALVPKIPPASAIPDSGSVVSSSSSRATLARPTEAGKPPPKVGAPTKTVRSPQLQVRTLCPSSDFPS
ncbi:unnamed protein product [Dimorphilus gyrociliatus]|uniref:C2H2-type domain-containing protein n=1 Tax=Dimorphilus gyrociliatus TaxID=2664684 RepID=A0A7I8W605_9ANNE|nr:unnamed protein product [Dimorphilus gyrociliatus]